MDRYLVLTKRYLDKYTHYYMQMFWKDGVWCMLRPYERLTNSTEFSSMLNSQFVEALYVRSA